MLIHAIFPQTEDYRSAINLLRKYSVLEHVDLYEVLCHAKKCSSLIGLYDGDKLCGCICLFPHRYSQEAFCILSDASYAEEEQKKTIESYLTKQYPKHKVFLNVVTLPVV